MPILAEPDTRTEDAPDVLDLQDAFEELAPPCEAPARRKCEESASWVVWFHFCHLCARQTGKCLGHLFCHRHKDAAMVKTLLCPRCELPLNAKRIEVL